MVSAFGKNEVLSPVNPVTFENVVANIGNMWNETTHTFTMKAVQGIFYVAMATTAYYQQPLDFILQKSGQPFASCSDTYIMEAVTDASGRDIILKVSSSETLHFSSSTGLVGYEGATSIGIFNILELMSYNNDPVAFSVARDTSFSDTVNPMPFNQILFNDNSLYDVSTNKFTAPSSGFYFFTFSVGVPAFMPVKLVLYVNDVPFTSIIRESTSHNGTDVIGRSIMMYLNESDMVHVAKEDNTGTWHSDLRETSFAGFKYEPAYGNKVKKHDVLELIVR